MKPIMLFAVIMTTAIILAASFGLHVMPIEPLHKLPADMIGHVLYVCPAADSVWDAIAKGLGPAMRYINMAFFAGIVLLMFNWGWALYQNLLKDDFKKDAFQSPWMFTKALFWIIVVVAVLHATPNHYRSVHLNGAEGNWALCEENTPGALPVLSNAVKR